MINRVYAINIYYTVQCKQVQFSFACNAILPALITTKSIFRVNLSSDSAFGHVSEIVQQDQTGTIFHPS